MELPASQLVCHSLRPETQKERGAMGEGVLHLFPSLPPSLALLTFEPVFPLLRSCFYISCLRLPSKGQRACVFSMDTCVCVYMWGRLYVAGTSHTGFSSALAIPILYLLELRSSKGAFPHSCAHTHTQDVVITLCSHVILMCCISIHCSISDSQCQDLDSLQSH